MLFNRLKRQFTSRRSAEDGSSIPAIWVAGSEEATLINPDSGKVYAYVWHDGCGKYYPTVIVSPWRAFQLIRREAASLVSLSSFPRCTVELYRLRTDAMGDAQKYAEYGLNDHD